MTGWTPRSWHLLEIGLCIILPLGLAGGLLGLWWPLFGIRTACPECGIPSNWIFIPKSTVAVACDQCGCVGGDPLWNWQPVPLDDGEDSDEEEEDSNEPS
jgi:hypothetical protein